MENNTAFISVFAKDKIYALQINIKSSGELIEFVDKHTNGMGGRFLTMETNGFGIYTPFGKLLVKHDDWIIWDGCQFIPYTKENFIKVYETTKNKTLDRR